VRNDNRRGVGGAQLKHNPAKRWLGRVGWLCVSY
jgi:hypothetical protein